MHFFAFLCDFSCIYSGNSLFLQRFWNIIMNFFSFREKILPLGCVSSEQINLLFPGYDRNSLTRWTHAGRLIKLRRGWYALAECAKEREFACYVATKLVNPSYLSLHWALAFYGIIPETIVAYTSVTSQKPQRFCNALGTFSYQSVAPHLFFGYAPQALPDGRTYMLATPEKALLDLLYLHPEYQTEGDMLALRLDDDYLATELDRERLRDYLARCGNAALSQRLAALFTAYHLTAL